MHDWHMSECRLNAAGIRSSSRPLHDYPWYGLLARGDVLRSTYHMPWTFRGGAPRLASLDFSRLDGSILNPSAPHAKGVEQTLCKASGCLSIVLRARQTAGQRAYAAAVTTMYPSEVGERNPSSVLT
jgi:hypothetical protein